MTSSPDNPQTFYASKKSEIIIASLGLLGVLGTGVFSNWDKMFPERGVVQAAYAGYRPTGNFETELRYYLDVSGTRKALENYSEGLIKEMEQLLIAKSPKDAEEIHEIMTVAIEMQPTYDQVVKTILPVYQKYFTIPELQELNKFYSTEAMQNMSAKLPLIMQDLRPIQVKQMHELQQKFLAKLTETLKSKDE